ncbi:uncharacterized protein BDR25DRAFT_353078 [Lindgomyces ingoldianus]|uniref:Uncharacterized protein n=1 Tax=Lindgomyces ingoldianus TaxID=673940 RepID=A0ACB6R0Y8_9PLEO|nr:uncharacterized protein BDR25DRAFT_353078 [Lindgomyces ingoldianus]KAF2472755.1 hypothetical protein BDR25DRAFT_353078 [Lindgomyces ingoldianus]
MPPPAFLITFLSTTTDAPKGQATPPIRLRRPSVHAFPLSQSFTNYLPTCQLPTSCALEFPMMRDSSPGAVIHAAFTASWAFQACLLVRGSLGISTRKPVFPPLQICETAGTALLETKLGNARNLFRTNTLPYSSINLVWSSPPDYSQPHDLYHLSALTGDKTGDLENDQFLQVTVLLHMPNLVRREPTVHTLDQDSHESERRESSAEAKVRMFDYGDALHTTAYHAMHVSFAPWRSLKRYTGEQDSRNGQEEMERQQDHTRQNHLDPQKRTRFYDPAPNPRSAIVIVVFIPYSEWFAIRDVLLDRILGLAFEIDSINPKLKRRVSKRICGILNVSLAWATDSCSLCRKLEYLEELIGCISTRVICRIVAWNSFAFGVMACVSESCLMKCWDEKEESKCDKEPSSVALHNPNRTEPPLTSSVLPINTGEAKLRAFNAQYVISPYARARSLIWHLRWLSPAPNVNYAPSRNVHISLAGFPKCGVSVNVVRTNFNRICTLARLPSWRNPSSTSSRVISYLRGPVSSVSGLRFLDKTPKLLAIDLISHKAGWGALAISQEASSYRSFALSTNDCAMVANSVSDDIWANTYSPYRLATSTKTMLRLSSLWLVCGVASFESIKRSCRGFEVMLSRTMDSVISQSRGFQHYFSSVKEVLSTFCLGYDFVTEDKWLRKAARLRSSSCALCHRKIVLTASLARPIRDDVISYWAKQKLNETVTITANYKANEDKVSDKSYFLQDASEGAILGLFPEVLVHSSSVLFPNMNQILLIHSNQVMIYKLFGSPFGGSGVSVGVGVR